MSKESRRLKKELRMARKQADRDRERWGRELDRQRQQAAERTASYNKRTDALTKQLEALQISNQQSIDKITSGYESQLAQSQKASQQQVASLNALVMQNQKQYEQQYKQLDAQRAAADAAFAEQQRISRNLANANVPQAQASAMAPVSAASELSQLAETRKKDQNTLSSLSIVSRPGVAGQKAANLTGLQIA